MIGQKLVRAGVFGAAIVLIMTATLSVTPYLSSADTRPPAGVPATVSADPLPTVQIDGIVRAQVTVGNTVYATGKFAAARPAGVALGGAGTVTRSNLLAYNLTTGVLVAGFNHSLTGTNAEGRAIAASPDGKRLYVGGSFSAADGQPRANLAAFDITTANGSLVSGFTSGPSGTVRAVAATNTRAYVGGSFTTAGGQPRQHVAAYELSGALATNWKPSVTSNNNSYMSVTAMVVTPAQNNLIIGGSFNQVNGLQYLSNAAVKLDTGAPVTPWASTSSSFPIRDQVKLNAPSGNAAEISSLTTDGSQVYLTSWGYGSAYLDGFFEGRAAISPVNGNIIWINDCHGDTYGAFPVGGVLYSVSHAHDCRMMGLWGDLASERALAETTTGITGNNVAPTDPKYSSFAGYGHTSQLAWRPILNTGTVSGSSQAAWTVTGNASYISLGGEFTKANGVAQQGLVRYGISTVAPNKIGPAAFTGYGVAVKSKAANGNPTLTLTGTSDPDNENLTYKLYRDGGTTPIYTTTLAGRFWKIASTSFTDTGVTTASHKYVWEASDPFGNKRTTGSAIDDSLAIAYGGSGWVTQTGQATSRGLLGNSLHYTTANGATATISFNGPTIAILTEKSPTRGTMTISLDGGAPVTFDAYNATSLPQQVAFSRTGLAAGAHTAVVTKTGGTTMVIDGFVITNP